MRLSTCTVLGAALLVGCSRSGSDKELAIAVIPKTVHVESLTASPLP